MPGRAGKPRPTPTKLRPDQTPIKLRPDQPPISALPTAPCSQPPARPNRRPASATAQSNRRPASTACSALTAARPQPPAQPPLPLNTDCRLAPTACLASTAARSRPRPAHTAAHSGLPPGLDRTPGINRRLAPTERPASTAAQTPTVARPRPPARPPQVREELTEQLVVMLRDVPRMRVVLASREQLDVRTLSTALLETGGGQRALELPLGQLATDDAVALIRSVWAAGSRSDAEALVCTFGRTPLMLQIVAHVIADGRKTCDQ
eukprot:55955-Chlamydomonas_euryale.AAC.1